MLVPKGLQKAKTSVPCLLQHLQSAFATLIVANADGFVDSREEDLSVTDLTGASRRHDSLYCSLDHLVRQNHFELDLGNQVNRVFPSSIELGVAFLPAVASGFKHGHTLDTDLVERVFNRFQL